MFGVEIDKLRDDLRKGGTPELKRRRAIVGLSLLGIASMSAVALLQTGILKRLPDLPFKGFDTEKVTLSDDACQFGAPDATLAVTTLAANLPLAGFGDAQRARNQPLIPLAAAAKAGMDTAVSAWSFHRMLFKEKAWCSYCVIGGLVNIGVLALSIPEAMEAVKSLRPRVEFEEVEEAIVRNQSEEVARELAGRR